MTAFLSGRSSGPETGSLGRTSAVAWVESPLQLLSVIEAHRSGLLSEQTDIQCRADVPVLRTTALALEDLQLPPGVRPWTWASRPHRAPNERGTWALGDPFSGRVQSLLLTSSPKRVVLVDDGLATLHLLGLLVRRWAPLNRARIHPRLLRRGLGAVAGAKLRALARAGGLIVCTSLRIDDDLSAACQRAGIDLRTHQFDWLRTQPAGPVPDTNLIVLGTSLVANGLVRREPYLEWITSLADREALTYLPHRGEQPEVLADLARNPRITVTPRGLPVEMTLRGAQPRHRIVTLPSTAAISLRLLLAGSGAEIDALHVPDDWWTARTLPSLRRHLDRSVEAWEGTAL